jgi:hypothetical protein
MFFHFSTLKGAFFRTMIDISVTKFAAPGPTATILSIGISTCNFPVALFFFLFATPKPVVLPLPFFVVFVHSIAF